MKEKLRRFMQGRYGLDQLGRFMMYLTFVLIIIAMFTRWQIVSALAWVTLICYFFRAMSRNTAKRYQENAKFLSLTKGIRGRFRFARQRWNDRHEHKYFACPNCHAQMRVPKGRGKIRITCSRCHTEFERKS